MKNIIYHYMGILCLVLLGGLSACKEETVLSGQAERVPITLAGEIDQLALTRVDDGGFCDGDVMGVYVVDYQGNVPGTLQDAGNRATNVKHTFDEAAYRWDAAYDIYWKDEHTPVDIYGYYPFASPGDVNAYEFTVQKDQSRAAEGGALGGYEASDFLWGKAEKIAPTEKVIRLSLRHRMSNARVTLAKGEGFADGEWERLEKMVLVKNTVRDATIDLATGTVTPVGDPEETGTIPYTHGGEYRAIVVPQTVPAGKELFVLTVGGVNYTFKKADDFTYLAGRMHNFTIRVDKKSPAGEYVFTLTGESVTSWEADLASHDATAKEYIIIDSEAGHLREAILAANKDIRELRNLKITGEINGVDFYFMRDSMDYLQFLNLKEVKIARTDTLLYYGTGALQRRTYDEDEIPEGALGGKESLYRLILPDRLKVINCAAFEGCKNLSGSLTIPEGVTDIYAGAFVDCQSFTGTLTLPSTLKRLGHGEEKYWYGGPFKNCKFACELKLPTGLEYIGDNCFEFCANLYGSLHLPENLQHIGDYAFADCSGLTGSLEIPQGVTTLMDNVFERCGFDGTLQLHDGITTIGKHAFSRCHFKGELVLPKDLLVLNDYVFDGCDFSGVLVLPKRLRSIGNYVFGSPDGGSNWRLSGILEIPEEVLTIGQYAFYECKGLEGIVFSAGVESIMNNAFYMCTGLGSIVCKGTVPPYVQGKAFDGVPKDNFAVEVPESSVQQYQAEPGWSEFKRITAHHELVCRPALACAINTECKRTLVIDSEGEWTVDSMPDWCSLSATSGNRKTELTLTIHAMDRGAQQRIGEIVFRLTDKDYTARCTVSQYDYEYAEDEVVTLQRATKGKGVNLVFLGDGFNAEDIACGDYLKAMKEQVEHFFAIEPYTTYRDYFNVYTAIALSPESGIGTVNTIRYSKFGTTFTGGVGLRCDYDAVFQYVVDMRTPVTRDNLNRTLIVMTPNTTDYGGICQMWDDGSAIAFCPMSDYGYPYDARGVIQHEAGGHGFGKLGDEYIYHNEFIDFCSCTCCGHVDAFNVAKANGWYDNLALTGKMHEVPWSHLLFDDRYSDIVDVFEGGFMHNRGVWRSEQNSCMNNDIPYYSTISRESIVRRILTYAGEEYTFEKFVANDKRSAGVATRAVVSPYAGYGARGTHYAPQIHRGSPSIRRSVQ